MKLWSIRNPHDRMPNLSDAAFSDQNKICSGHQGVLLVLEASHTHTYRFLFCQVILFLYLWVLTLCSLTWQKDIWKNVWHSRPHLCWVTSGVNIIINPLTQFISCWCFRILGNCLQILGCAMRSRVCKTEWLQRPWHFVHSGQWCLLCSSVYSKIHLKMQCLDYPHSMIQMLVSKCLLKMLLPWKYI